MIERIISFGLRKTYALFNKNRFGDLGRNSYFRHIDRMIGRKNIFIGDNVSFLHHARIEALEEYNGEPLRPVIRIGSNCGFGRFLHLEACKSVVIGHDVLVSENVFISDCKHDYNVLNVNIAYQDLQIAPVVIGDYCFIGRNACILPGVQLGKQCVVGANAVVPKGVYPDYSVIAGIPARIIKTIDRKASDELTIENKNDSR